jgi:hypothetical protein
MPFGLGFFATTGAGAAAGAYELIQSQVLGTSAASVTFSSIPQTYRHLQIRYVSQNSTSTVNQIQLNGDTGANYDWHILFGDGSNVFSSAVNNTTFWQFVTPFTADGASFFGSGVLDILDYSSTSKNTTSRLLAGSVRGSSNQVRLLSGLWRNTAAVTSIALNANGNNFVSGSRFSLYGLRG